MFRIEVQKVDITTLDVDAIVNAANETLLGGGGVDGEIHRKAGSDLLIECWSIGGCKVGNACSTQSYNLPTKFIIHTVGPRYEDGRQKEHELLIACYINSLQLAVDLDVKTIAFTAISCGAYRFPISEAAEIAMATVAEFLATNESIEKVIFACLGETYETFERALDRINR